MRSNVESKVGEDHWIGESLQRLVYGSNGKQHQSRGEVRRRVRSGTGVGCGRCVEGKRRHVSGSGQETGQPIGGGCVCDRCCHTNGGDRCSKRLHQQQA
jgi:hypothetical protein